MIQLFKYNWQVREEWLNWCSSVPAEELLKARTGGCGSILKTLFHIIEVEHSWTVMLRGNPDPGEPPFGDYASLERIVDYSAKCHEEIAPLITQWCQSDCDHLNEQQEHSGGAKGYSLGHVLRHMIAHEIHHVGQLSIWAREMGLEPVSVNLIGRSL
jgi:uncharacterized damage-inducible protein DinB